MKKVIVLLTVVALLLSVALPVLAADGKVTYTKNAGEFVFESGSDHQLTDLFPNFKGVMPGDTLTQKITVKNDADKRVKVKIYLRSLGAHEDSVDFLSQLHLKVAKSEENQMAYMFDAQANEQAQLSDWVCLGTLYSGGVVDLDVTLSVGVDLSNEYQNKIGYLDWEFMVEELPVEPSDPKPPQTGDDFNMDLWLVIMLCSAAALIILFLLFKKNREKEENTEKE